MSDLDDLRNDLLAATDKLLDERDAADAAGNTAKVAAAKAELDRLNTVMATVQFAIDRNVALNMNAVAARLQDSINAQRAIGLSSALDLLNDAIVRARG